MPPSSVKSLASRSLNATPVKVISISAVPLPSESISSSFVVSLNRASELLLPPVKPRASLPRKTKPPAANPLRLMSSLSSVASKSVIVSPAPGADCDAEEYEYVSDPARQ